MAGMESKDIKAPPLSSGGGILSSPHTPSIFVNFNEGFCVKHVFDFANKVTTEADILFSRDKVEICQSNPNKTVLIYFLAEEADILDYRYNVKHSDTVPVGINIVQMQKHLAGIKKAESIILEISSDFSMITGSVPGGIGTITIPTVKSKSMRYTLPAYTRERENVKIKACEMQDVFKSISRTTYAFVRILSYDRGVIVEAVTAGNSVSQRFPLGDPQPDEKVSSAVVSEPSVTPSGISLPTISGRSPTGAFAPGSVIAPNETRLDKKIVDQLAKIAGMAPKASLVKMVHEPGKPFLIKCHVGSTGPFSIYIRTPKSSDPVS